MAIQKFALALKDFNFPLISKMRGISVVIPALDQEREVPQPYWIENLMPAADGLISVKYSDEIMAPATDAITGVLEYNSPLMKDANIINLITSEGTATYYLITPIYHFLYNTITAAWEVVEDTSTILDTTYRTSHFFYKGRTILYNGNKGFWSYAFDEVTGYAQVVENQNGLVLNEIESAIATNSYIIVATENQVYWSSPLSGNSAGDSIEFDPTNITLTGAGSTKILTLKGKIKVLVSKPNGFYIYTDKNTIEANMTGNTKNPWSFLEVKNSAGGTRTDLITSANNAGVHFSWGDIGLLSIQNGSAKQQFPQLTELFTGSIWENWNDVTKEIEQELGVRISVKLSFVVGRYLCFSYGKKNAAKEYILVLDTALSRWGKLKIKHLDVFDSTPPVLSVDPNKIFSAMQTTTYAELQSATPYFNYIGGSSEENFRAATIAILTDTHEIVIADFSQQTDMGEGMLIYGGIALTRRRLTEITDIELSGVWDSANTSLELRTSDVSGDWVPTYYDDVEDNYKADSVGKEHELKLKGNFMLSTIVLDTTQLGTS